MITLTIFNELKSCFLHVTTKEITYLDRADCSANSVFNRLEHVGITATNNTHIYDNIYASDTSYITASHRWHKRNKVTCLKPA